jgi:AcrR family transcriptional regulator
MARAPARERLATIATAGTEVFGRLGYRGTRTADVAREAGISSGSLFTYVESKEALFYLVFAHRFGRFDEVLPPLPLPTPAPGETIELIGQELRKVPAPRLRAAFGEDRPPDAVAELRGIVDERYGIIESLWPLLAVIERCALDLPELDAFYFGQARRGFFARLTEYIEMRASRGYLRATPDAAVTARLIIESVTWFAWKRRQGRDARTYNDELVRRSVLDFVCAALAPGTEV